MASYANPFTFPRWGGETNAAPFLPSSPLEQGYLNENPTAGWWRYLLGIGHTGMTPEDRYAQNSQSRFYNFFTTHAAEDPNQGFYDWLRAYAPDPGQEFQLQSPEQRGDFSSRTLTPRARWVING